MKMKIGIFGESSGEIREACRALGYDAVSVDYSPTKRPGPHIRGNFLDVMNWGCWGLGIFHPTCTFMCSSGLHWNKRVPGRQTQTDKSIEEVRLIMDCKIPKWAIENPIGCISSRIRKPDQIIQPWQFGHPESKATCLWLKGLPLLRPTNILPPPTSGHWENQTASGQNKLPPSADRWEIRSKTYTGIAKAIAEQWTM